MDEDCKTDSVVPMSQTCRCGFKRNVYAIMDARSKTHLSKCPLKAIIQIDQRSILLALHKSSASRSINWLIKASLFLVVLLILVNLEVSEGVGVLGGSDDTKEVLMVRTEQSVGVSMAKKNTRNVVSPPIGSSSRTSWSST